MPDWPSADATSWTVTFDEMLRSVEASTPEDDPAPEPVFCADCGDDITDTWYGRHEWRSDEADYAGLYGDLVCTYCRERHEDAYYEDHRDAYDDDVYEPDDPASYEVEVVNEPEPEDSVSAVDDPVLLLPAIPGTRDARRISFEQEIARGGRDVTLALYRAGIGSNDYVESYHGGALRGDAICYVEHDGSVDSEIIWSKLKLHQPNTARRFEEGIGIVREHIAEGTVKLNMHCGGHMHVDASGLDMQAAMSLYVLWNHVEDAMFRIAAANWSAHRTQVAYENYSPAARKGLKTRTEVWNHMNYDRGALNLSNFFRARANCRCGATQVGAWDECTCSLSRQTVEFRVWNTTANLRKINAYSALCVAMVEYARRHTMTVEDYPEHGWTASRTAAKQHTEDAMRFIMEDLPLTDRERDNVRYCVERCSLAELYA